MPCFFFTRVFVYDNFDIPAERVFSFFLTNCHMFVAKINKRSLEYSTSDTFLLQLSRLIALLPLLMSSFLPSSAASILETLSEWRAADTTGKTSLLPSLLADIRTLRKYQNVIKKIKSQFSLSIVQS